MMMSVWNVGNVDLCWTKAFTDSRLDVHAFCTSHFHLNANLFHVSLIIDQRVDRERGISWELIHPSNSGSSVGEALAAETSPLRLHPPFLPLPHSRPPATSPLGLMHHLMAHFHLRCTINRASYHFKAYTCNISPRLPSVCKGTAKYSGTRNCGGDMRDDKEWQYRDNQSKRKLDVLNKGPIQGITLHKVHKNVRSY